MLRNTALNLRFLSLAYLSYVSRREIRVRLVLLASCFVFADDGYTSQYTRMKYVI